MKIKKGKLMCNVYDPAWEFDHRREERKESKMEGMERKTGTVDVQKTVTGDSFIKIQGVDSEAAFQRMTITKKMLGEYQEAINSTNTVDVIGNLQKLYDDLEVIAKAIIREEQLLISIGA